MLKPKRADSYVKMFYFVYYERNNHIHDSL